MIFSTVISSIFKPEESVRQEKKFIVSGEEEIIKKFLSCGIKKEKYAKMPFVVDKTGVAQNV